MEYITKFLNSTTLTAGQQILVSIFTATITTVVFIPIIKSFFASIKTYLEKIFISTHEKYRRYKRLRNGNLSVKEYLAIAKKLENGQSISEMELNAYNKTNEKMKVNLSQIISK